MERQAPNSNIAEITPSKERYQQFDAVFVFPGYTFPQEKIRGGLKTNIEGVVERFAGLPQKTHRSGLLFDTRLKDIAAVLMVRRGETNKIVTMSRKTRSWMTRSNAELGANHISLMLDAKKRGTKIIKEGVSYDTSTEVEQVQKISEERGFKRIAIIVTDSQTAKRVLKLIELTSGSFPEYEIRTIESVLLDNHYGTPKVRRHLRDIMQKYEHSMFLKFWGVRERLVGTLETVAPRLLSKLSQKTR